MKRIEAIIRPGKVSGVCEALEKASHPGVTNFRGRRTGNQKGWVNEEINCATEDAEIAEQIENIMAGEIL